VSSFDRHLPETVGRRCADVVRRAGDCNQPRGWSWPAFDPPPGGCESAVPAL